MADDTSEVKIRITGDDSGATGALKRVIGLLNGGVVKALDSVRSGIARVMSALGLFGMAVSGIMLVVEGYKRLTDWMNRAAKAAAELRIASVFKDAADAMNRLISRQAIYNKLLKEELADLNRRKELQGIKQSGKEQRETEKREIARAKEIAGAANEDEERAIRQRWAEEDELRERGKRYRELKGNVAEETEKAAIYGSKARVAEENVKAADDAIADLRANFVRMDEARFKEAMKEIAALQEKRKANAEAAAELRKEAEMAEKRAELYRQQIDDVRNGGGVAKAKNEAENAKIAREKAEQDFEERQKKARESDKAATEFVKAYEEDQRKEEEQRVERGEAWRKKLAAQQTGVSQNRLTAMGLGSGGIDRTAQDQAKDVKTLVSLVREQIAATRENKPTSRATYAP